MISMKLIGVRLLVVGSNYYYSYTNFVSTYTMLYRKPLLIPERKWCGLSVPMTRIGERKLNQGTSIGLTGGNGSNGSALFPFRSNQIQQPTNATTTKQEASIAIPKIKLGLRIERQVFVVGRHSRRTHCLFRVQLLPPGS